MKPKSVYPANDTLGEGPVWNPDEEALYWVDIMSKRLQRWHPESETYTWWTLPSEIGSYALREKGGAIVALKDGFHFLDLDSGELSAVHDPEADLDGNRFNDGKCDRQGRFWAGTMGSGDAPTGAFYRLDAGLECQTIRTGVGVSNGLGWSPDNTTMYYTDSSLQTIFAFDYDADMGTLSGERIFAEVKDGFPDGLTVDSEGHIWSATWDGWRINRFAPDGTLVAEIEMPVQRPTSCMFGGKNLDELFITSASVGLSDEEKSKQPEAGHVFKLQTDIKGLPESKFAG